MEPSPSSSRAAFGGPGARARRGAAHRGDAPDTVVLRHQLVELSRLGWDCVCGRTTDDTAGPRRTARIRAAPAADDGRDRSQLLCPDADRGSAELRRAAPIRLSLLHQGAGRVTAFTLGHGGACRAESRFSVDRTAGDRSAAAAGSGVSRSHRTDHSRVPAILPEPAAGACRLSRSAGAVSRGTSAAIRVCRRAAGSPVPAAGVCAARAAHRSRIPTTTGVRCRCPPSRPRWSRPRTPLQRRAAAVEAGHVVRGSARGVSSVQPSRGTGRGHAAGCGRRRQSLVEAPEARLHPGQQQGGRIVAADDRRAGETVQDDGRTHG